MAVATTATWSPPVDDIIRQGAQLCGIVPLGRSLLDEQMEHAREMLKSALQHLSALGVGLCQWQNTTLALTAGTAAYTLAADTIGVEFPMMLAVTGETSQTQVLRYTWEEYQQITDKTTSGAPTACYEEATHSVVLTFWPIPEQGYTLSYRRQRLIRDADSGFNVDLRHRWTEALVYTMAHKLALASSLGVERVRYLQEQADQKVAAARGREHESGDLTLCPDIAGFFM